MAGPSQPASALSVEGLVLAGAVATGASAVAVWVGAQLGALVFGGHRLLPVGVRDAALALPGLVAHPSRPRDAWPAAAAGGLPGAVGYWAATVPPLAFAVAAVGVLLAVTGRRVGVARRRRMGLDPEARFARLRDLAPLLVAGPRPGRLVLGTVRAGGRSRLVATEDAARPLDAAVPWVLRRGARRLQSDRGAVLALGPTRCGKTAALAVPAILEWQGPLVAVSVKTDLLGATEARRQAVGEVRVFDPAGATGRDEGAVWSPLAVSGRLAGARRAARSVAASTDWNAAGSGDMAFWASAGEDLVGLLFWLAARSGLGMDSVVAWVTTQDKDTVLALSGVYATHLEPAVAAEGRQVDAALQAVWRADSRQLSSLYLVARQMIRPWQEPAVQASASGGVSVDLDWLLGSTPAAAGVDPVGAGPSGEWLPDLSPYDVTQAEPSAASGWIPDLSAYPRADPGPHGEATFTEADRGARTDGPAGSSGPEPAGQEPGGVAWNAAGSGRGSGTWTTGSSAYGSSAGLPDGAASAGPAAARRADHQAGSPEPAGGASRVAWPASRWHEPGTDAEGGPPRATRERAEPRRRPARRGRSGLAVALPAPARANSLYLCADLDDAERLAPVLGGLVDELLRDVYARVGRTGKPLDPPLLVVIDEAGNWPMRSLPARISTCAGMGVVLLLLYQSKAQIDAAYGPKADIVVSNAPTKVFFSGLSDRSSLDYAASLLGQEHVAARSVSADSSPGGGRAGTSEAPTRLELLPAPLLRQVAPGEALLVHRTLPPAHLRGRYWFRDPGLRRLASGEPPRVGWWSRATAGLRGAGSGSFAPPARLRAPASPVSGRSGRRSR
ncbi:TraG/TraD/VirD4 family protein [Pseudofrankia sp. DC12]|uniref:TraG/TraD/VirD4 family protein n=1 Tax=Pseudofrankia sp. DC12 TaxID=683315 RepID=UPI000AFC924E|nr:TraG/TraD/VirD4 family protein [Pseudofrankia sp. DC12]